MPAYIAAMAAKEVLAVRHDYVYVTLLVLKNHLNLFNAERAQIAAELLLGNFILPIVPDFGQAESARMALTL